MKQIGFYLFPDFQILDAAGPISVFEHVETALGEVVYELSILSAFGGPIRSSAGAVMQTQSIDQLNPPLDTLIVVGGSGSRRALDCQKTLSFVRFSSQQARRVCSVCTGSFILAEAGVLDGRKASTHWQHADRFAKRYPHVLLNADNIYTQDGNIWTSAGVTAGIDLSLALIAQDVGEAAAQAIARGLVVYYQRPGGQSQFSPLLDFTTSNGKFTSLIGWIRGHLGGNLGVFELSQQMGMSERNFSRAFTREMGISPAKAVERIRVDAARARIEQASVSLERIATDCGFTNADHMRRAFIRNLGFAPQTLRRFAKYETD